MAAPATGGKLASVGDAAQSAANRGLADVESLLAYKLLKSGGLDITVGGLIAAALAIVVAWTVSVLVRRAIRRYAGRQTNVNPAALYTVSRVVHYVLLALGALIALDVAGIPIAKLSIFAGAVGVGLGFGLQAIFSNFVAGLILLFDRSLKVGDFVELESGVHGEVRDIKIRATRITTNDNIDILVPNSEFVAGRVVNWTLRDGSRRMRIPFGVAYGAEKETVKQAALEAAAEVPFTGVLEGVRKPQVWLVAFGDSSLNFELVVWLTAEATKRPGAVKAAYLWALHSALERHGIEIPFPQQDLHVRSLFGHRGSDAIALLRAIAVGEDMVEPPARTASERPAQASTNDAVQDVENEIALETRAQSEAPPDGRARPEQ